jgi:hypothetical protein
MASKFAPQISDFKSSLLSKLGPNIDPTKYLSMIGA